MQAISVSELLKQKSLRETELRRTILSLFLNASKPLSVPQVQEMLVTLGVDANKTTLYRQVEIFLKADILKALQLEPEKTHYEMAEMAHHHHLVCTECEKIEHLEVPSLESQIAVLSHETQINSGFTVMSHTLEFYGLCKKCFSTQK